MARTPGKKVNTLGPQTPPALGDIQPELKEGQPVAPSAQPVPQNMRSKFGPGQAPALYAVEGHIAGEPAAEGDPGRDQGPTRPCPECGWPLPNRAKVCTRCGFSREKGAALGTQVAAPVEAPEPLPDTRFQTYMHDPMLAPGAWWKAAGVLGSGLVMATASNALGASGLHGATGLDAAGVYLLRFVVTMAMVVGLYLAASMVFIDYTGPFLLLLLRLGAALALADGVQYLFDTPGSAVEGFYVLRVAIGFLLALVCFMGVLTNLLDMDFQDAIFYTGMVYVGKLVLNVLVFRHMFAGLGG